jgi:hypothetical protein
MNRKVTRAEMEGRYVGEYLAARGLVCVRPGHYAPGVAPSWYLTVALPSSLGLRTKTAKQLVARVADLARMA